MKSSCFAFIFRTIRALGLAFITSLMVLCAAHGQGAPTLEPQVQSPAPAVVPDIETTLKLVAVYRPEGPVIDGNLVWRVFEAEPEADGSFKLVVRSSDPSPIFALNVGSYIVHVAVGYSRATQLVQLGEQPQSLSVILPVGGLQLSSNIGKSGDDHRVRFDILDTELDSFGERKMLLKDAPVNVIIPLSEGAYQIISSFGDANAVIREDVVIEAAQLTTAVVEHKAASITLKLVSEEGGEALADTAWTVLDAAGNIIKEGVGAFPVYVLSEGEYSVIASHNGETYSREFDVIAGADKEIELLAENPSLKP